MKTLVLLLMSSLLTVPAKAQTEGPPPLDYTPVPDGFALPAGMNFGGVSGVAINSKGHIFVLHRGPSPLMEFDADGQFIRGWGEGLFDRPHGLRIDAQDNIWATDVGSHVVYKFNPQGRLVMVLGVKGRPGEWHEFGHLRLFNEPNDMAFAPNGDVYIVQGHGKGEPRVLKFDKEGTFIKTWGKKGKEPGNFDIAHSIVIDAKGLLYVADRNNQRIQVFDADGNYIRESKHPGTPCGLFISPDQTLWLAHGHVGQVMKLDLGGNVLGVTGSQGKGLNQFGEAHYIAVSARNEIYVADTLNWRIQKYVKR
jgi:DNA-binding beta-propeller fold protein YncE